MSDAGNVGCPDLLEYSIESQLIADGKIELRESEALKHHRLTSLGKRITAARRKRGLSLEGLAYGVGISKGNLSDIENFKRDPRYSTLVAIADGLDLSLSELLQDL